MKQKRTNKPGAGRPAKFTEESETVTIRIPKSKKTEILIQFEKYLSFYWSDDYRKKMCKIY